LLAAHTPNLSKKKKKIAIYIVLPEEDGVLDIVSTGAHQPM
jgi:hypothetical protein